MHYTKRKANGKYPCSQCTRKFDSPQAAHGHQAMHSMSPGMSINWHILCLSKIFLDQNVFRLHRRVACVQVSVMNLLNLK